jgi:hypothetical protein
MTNSDIVDLTFMIFTFVFTELSLLAATVKYSEYKCVPHTAVFSNQNNISHVYWAETSPLLIG